MTGLASAPDSAKLRLFVTDDSPDGGSVFKVANSWTETGITWGNAPRGRRQLAGRGRRDDERHVGRLRRHAAVTGNGEVSFALTTTSSNSSYYSSREGANRPQLVLLGGEAARDGDPHGGRRHGPAGLAVDRQGVLPAAARAHGVARRVSATTAGRRARRRRAAA